MSHQHHNYLPFVRVLMGSWTGLKVGVEGVVKDVEEGVVVA